MKLRVFIYKGGGADDTYLISCCEIEETTFVKFLAYNDPVTVIFTFLSVLWLSGIFPGSYSNNNLSFGRKETRFRYFLESITRLTHSIVFFSSIQPSKIGTTLFMWLISGKWQN